jgi:subtilisin family serine protease
MKTQILLSVILVSVLSLAPIFTGAIYTGSDATPSPDGVLADNAVIVLKDQPLASYDGHVQGYAKTMPTPGHKLDLSSAEAQSYSQYLANGRGLAKGWLQNNAPEVQVIDEYSVVLNGIAVQLNGHSMNHLFNAPGASWVVPDYLFHLEMNRSPTLIGAPVLWNAVGGQSNAGAGVKIGIIDTGIDQTHPFLTDNTLPALA